MTAALDGVKCLRRRDAHIRIANMLMATLTTAAFLCKMTEYEQMASTKSFPFLNVYQIIIRIIQPSLREKEKKQTATSMKNTNRTMYLTLES